MEQSLLGLMIWLFHYMIYEYTPSITVFYV